MEEEKKTENLEELQESNTEDTNSSEEVIDNEEVELEESNLSEYQIKLNEYQYRLEEALVNIEVKENIALANEEDSEAKEEYVKAKEAYEALRKEYKQYKKENAPKTWWTTLPLRMKIFSVINVIFTFPYLAWSVFHFWSYPYIWFYEIFSDGLNKLYGDGKKALVYIYLGIFWYLLVAILIASLVVIGIKIKKDDVDKDYKKTYVGFIIGNGVLILGLLIYQIVMMMQAWF